MADNAREAPLGFTPSHMVRCPCGQWCMIGEDQGGTPGVLHQEPMCEQFRALDTLQFVRFLRQYYEALERPRKRHRDGRLPRKGSN